MEKHNTVHAIFASGAKEAEIIDDVWQYDFGQTLQISGLSLPPTIEIHYANKGRDAAIPQVGVTKDGITTAPIPNEILSEKGSFTAYIFLTDGKSGETCYTITGYTNKRPAMKGFNTPEDQEILHAAVGAVNAAAERAESAETKATEAANQTAEDAKQTAADRAEVERLVESVSGIGEQVTKVENLTKQAQTSATNAALSEQAAKTAETNAQAAQAGAEAAEGNAELAERNVKASEQAVEKAKQLVAQMGQEVLKNKNHVDQTVQAFDQTAQQAVADVNNAGQTQTERVQSAGNTAVESVKTAQTAATKAVEAAKTEAVKAVQTEGTTQTGNVTAEGTKQVQAVQAAAQEIMVDREQIAQNKADITTLKEDLVGLDNRKADAIVETASGNPCNISDSSDLLIKKLNIYGESTQEGTPSPALPVPIISKEISKITVTGKELEKQETILSKPITLRGVPVESGGNVTIDGKQYVSDIICEHNGIISVERNVEKALLKKDIVFTQTEDNPYRCACFVAIIGGGKLKRGPDTSLSNCFQWIAWGSNVSSVKDKVVFAISESTIYISLPRTGAEPSKEGAENRVNELWQSVKDKVEFYAQLKTPVYEPLPETDQDAIKNLHSYYPNTTIECGAWTEVSYIADTKKYIDKKFEELNQAIVNTQIALL